MKVRELIDLLKQNDLEDEVLIGMKDEDYSDNDECYCEIESVMVDRDFGVILTLK